MNIPRLLLVLGLLGGLVGRGRAEFIFYFLPTKDRSFIVFEGSSRKSGPGTITVDHARFGSLIFSKESVRVFKVADVAARLNQQMTEAYEGNDAEALLRLAHEALRKGYLKPFWRAAKAAGEVAPDHPRVKILSTLREQMDGEIPESNAEVKPARAYLRSSNLGNRLKVARSKHFIVLHDLSDAPVVTPKRGVAKSRLEERLELMEKVYESFLGFFASRGVVLKVPAERLRVILFSDRKDFEQNAPREMDMKTVKGLDGYWDSKVNISCFYNHSTHPEFVKVQEVIAELKDVNKRLVRANAQGRAEIIRFTKAFDVMVKIMEEELDIEVLSHEMTHQLAGSTGLLPKDRPIPIWVHEGLASYFESPRNCGWSGIAAVNEQRLDYYRKLEKDREHSNITFITTDRIFTHAKDLGAQLHGYGQAWALTHYLMENRFDDLMRFYRLLAALPPSNVHDEAMQQKIFDYVFSRRDRQQLDNDWRRYMNLLATDIEKAIGRKIRDDDKLN